MTFGDPYEPSLPRERPASDPDFIPAPAFFSPQEYREKCDRLTPENRDRARALLVHLRDSSTGRDRGDHYQEYLDALDA